MLRMHLPDYCEPGVTSTPDAADDFRMLDHNIAERSSERKSFKGSMNAIHAAIQALCPNALYMLDTLSFGDGDGAVVLSIQGEFVKRMRKEFPNLIVYGLSHEGYLALGGIEYEDATPDKTQDSQTVPSLNVPAPMAA